MLSTQPSLFSFFFFNDTATTEIYTLSLHDALPISAGGGVGVVEVALLLEVAHRVADRRRRQPELIALRNRPAARRLGGLDVRFDHGLEHLALAVGERSCHDGISICMVSSFTMESNRNQPSGVHFRRPSRTSIQPRAVRGGRGR